MLVSLQYSSLELPLLCLEVLTPDSELFALWSSLVCPCKQEFCCVFAQNICKYDKTATLALVLRGTEDLLVRRGWMDDAATNTERFLCAAARRNAKMPDPTQRMTAQRPFAEADAGHFAERDWLGH